MYHIQTEPTKRAHPDPSAILVIALMLSLELGILGLGPAEEPVMTADGAFTGSLMPMKLFFMENEKLTPSPPEADDDGTTMNVPNGFVENGRIPGIGHVEWKYIDTWSSSALHTDLIMENSATFSIWAFNDFNVHGSFRFSVTVNGQLPPVIGPVETGEVTIGETPIQVEAKANIGSNVTPVHKSDVMQVRVDGKINGGCTIAFGSGSFASGVRMKCSGLQIEKFEKHDSYAHVNVRDTWGVERHTIYRSLAIDGKVIDREPNYYLSNDLLRDHVWEWYIGDVGPGQHDMSVSISYGEGYGNAATSTASFNIVKPEESSTGIFIQIIIAIIIIAFLLTGAIVLVKVRHKRHRSGRTGFRIGSSGFKLKLPGRRSGGPGKR